MIRASVVDTVEGFDALQGEWHALLEVSESRVFQSFEWQRMWWKHFGEKNSRASLHLVTMRDGETVVGIAPLFIQRLPVAGPFTSKRLSFIGDETSDYLDVIMQRGKEREVLQCLAQHLRESCRTFNVLLLNDIPGPSFTHAELLPLLQAAGFTGSRIESEHCPRMSLLETWEETAKIFIGEYHTRLMKRFQKVREGYGCTFEIVESPEQMDQAMDDFIRIHQERWNAVGSPGGFYDARTSAFHRAVASVLSSRGWLYVGFLIRDGKRVGGDYGFNYRGIRSTYLGGIVGDRKFLRVSPGLALKMHLMMDAIRRRYTIYDFMRGREPYKYKFGAVDVPNWTLVLFPRPGTTIRFLHYAAILRFALHRRVFSEWVHLSSHAHRRGVFSRSFVSYCSGRLRVFVNDAIQKARSPEQSLVTSRSREEQTQSDE